MPGSKDKPFMLLDLGTPRPYSYTHNGIPPSFDRLPGKGVLLFSSLDTTQELNIAAHLDRLGIPTVIIPLPICRDTVKISIGSNISLLVYDRTVPFDRIGAVWSVNSIEMPLQPEDDPAMHGFIENEWRACFSLLNSRLPAAGINTERMGTLSRIDTLKLAERLGFSVPRTLITNDSAAAEKFAASINYDCVIKRVGHNLPTLQDGSTIPVFTRIITREDISSEGLSGCPILLQEAINRLFEYRVYVIGARVIPFRISCESTTDWRKGTPADIDIIYSSLDHITVERIKALTDLLGLKYAAIDFIQDKEGNLFLLEVNPHGNFSFCDSRVSPSISEQIASYLGDILRK